MGRFSPSFTVNNIQYRAYKSPLSCVSETSSCHFDHFRPVHITILQYELMRQISEKRRFDNDKGHSER